MIGRVNGSGTCPVEFQAIDPSVGKALLAAELGIDAKPSLHVRFNHGRSEIAPSVLVNVMSPVEESLVINAIERYESPFAIAA